MGLKHLILVFVTLSIFGMVLCKSGDPATVLAGGDDAALSNQSSTALPITSPSSNMTDDNTTSTEAPSTAAPQTNPSTAAPTGNTGGTTQSETTYTTAAPESSTSVTTAPPKCGRKFDTASFIGGMVLMLAVLSIVFFACKYYKSRTDQRYRQF